MSRYAQHNPDEPIRHDWYAGASRAGGRQSVDEHADATAYSNTDREIWRRSPGNAYSPSIHVTKQGAIGMSVGGYVSVHHIEQWQWAARLLSCPNIKDWRVRLAVWLLEAADRKRIKSLGPRR